MKKILDYIEIEYSDRDLEYIDSMDDILNEISREIISFFGIEKLETKVKVILFRDLDEFRKTYIKISEELYGLKECKDWVCGFAPDDNNIYTLCLEEYKKTKGHENEDLLSLIHLILHEFTHSMIHRINKDNKRYIWLGEGIACVLFHQYDKFEFIKLFDVTLEQMCYGNVSYNYYRTMFDYVLKTYGRDYILKLINDYNLLVSETPRLFDEVKNINNMKLKQY